MDEDDDHPKAPLLRQLVKEDLDPLSREDLQDRIDILRQEIKRAEEAIENKSSSRISAEKFFK